MSNYLPAKELKSLDQERGKRPSDFGQGPYAEAPPGGGHLKNDDTKDKIELGKAWSGKAGGRYRYYMVFEDGTDLPSGALGMEDFLSIAREL